MSQENVELVRKMCEAFIAGDVERALAVLDHEVEWHGTIGGLEEGQIARGRKEVIDGFSESLQEWESHAFEVQRFIDAGDRVVAFWHEGGRGRRSGAEVTTSSTVIYTVRSGRVIEVQPYMDRSEALKAVGLEG
jgi:ketosteroid isomerase-like protein